MASVSRPRFFLVYIAVFLFGAAFIIECYGMVHLFVTFEGLGSPVGSAILCGLGLFLLALSPFIFNFAITNWGFASPSPEVADS